MEMRTTESQEGKMHSDSDRRNSTILGEISLDGDSEWLGRHLEGIEGLDGLRALADRFRVRHGADSHRPR